MATSTLAAYVSFSDLGTPVIAGLNTNDTVEAFAGAVLVGLLAAVVAVGLGFIQRAVTPASQREVRRGGDLRSTGLMTGALAGTRS